MKKTKKCDFKKLALMGIAGGTALATQAGASEFMDGGSYSQLLAFAGCGGQHGCGGNGTGAPRDGEGFYSASRTTPSNSNAYSTDYYGDDVYHSPHSDGYSTGWNQGQHVPTSSCGGAQPGYYNQNPGYYNQNQGYWSQGQQAPVSSCGAAVGHYNHGYWSQGQQVPVSSCSANSGNYGQNQWYQGQQYPTTTTQVPAYQIPTTQMPGYQVPAGQSGGTIINQPPVQKQVSAGCASYGKPVAQVQRPVSNGCASYTAPSGQYQGQYQTQPSVGCASVAQPQGRVPSQSVQTQPGSTTTNTNKGSDYSQWEADGQVSENSRFNANPQGSRTQNSSSNSSSQNQATRTNGSLSESDLLSQLSPQGKATYQSLDPAGKALALKMANQDCKGQNECKGMNACKTESHACAGKGGCAGTASNSFKDKNLAVKVAAMKMAEKRANSASSNY